MKPKFNKIDRDKEFVNDGYNNYIQYTEVQLVDKKDFDGLLSLCIDSRIAVTQICSQFPTKEPVSTAGNAFQKVISKLLNFTNQNVLVTHGVHPENNKAHEPTCGGHALTLRGEYSEIYGNLIRSLKPYVRNNIYDYDPFLTTKNLLHPWHASKSKFYDHTTGDLYGLDNSRINLGINPGSQHEGLKPSLGQDPTLIVISTLGKPFLSLSKNRRAREIGGIIEIFYPESNLPQTIIESLVFCLREHYLNKNISSMDMKGSEEGQFRNSDTILFLAESERKLKALTKSILSAKNKFHRQFIEGYFKDPKDIVIGIVPEIDNKFFQITAK